MLTGTVVRTRELQSAQGQLVTIVILRPEATTANRVALLQTRHDWEQAAMRLTVGSEPAYRAYFASTVAWHAATTLDRCCIFAAQDQRGEVRGLILYHTEGQVWHLDLLTVTPRDQGGNPNRDPVRGIGGELLGAAAKDMEATACQTVELEPLDDKAERFWRSRGFTGPPLTPTAPNLRMSCTELQALAARYRFTPHDDADMLVDDGDASTRRYALRARPRLSRAGVA